MRRALAPLSTASTEGATNDWREYERKLSRQMHSQLSSTTMLRAKYSRVSGVGAVAQVFLAAPPYRHARQSPSTMVSPPVAGTPMSSLVGFERRSGPVARLLQNAAHKGDKRLRGRPMFDKLAYRVYIEEQSSDIKITGPPSWDQILPHRATLRMHTADPMFRGCD